MKKYLKTYPDKCIACHTCEGTCSNLYFKTGDVEKSCIRITAAEPVNDISACNQCEACVRACPTHALYVTHQGVVMVNKALCVSCYLCIGACPTNSMRRYFGGIYPFKCVACGACTKSCPQGAIKIVQE
ncbi:MAG: 4Fe-4S binding protein [Candidatus Cloacimonetes bacterium]|nr:4Fe-4S binding protein [Candidatus Cloacimonadota bacterium]